MDPMSGLNRGFAFVTFTSREEAVEAVKQLNSLEIASGKELIVNISVAITRLFVGNIPKSKTKDDIAKEFNKLSSGLVEVIIYSSLDDKKKNRGFCFLEYESHKSARQAKRLLGTGHMKVWSCDIIVDWADTQEEPDKDTMARVKVLYCRNLLALVTEVGLREMFERFGRVERVKKIKDYAFVHFEIREQALAAMTALNLEYLLGAKLEISLAKPPSDKKKKEEMLRRREQRMMQAMTECVAWPPAGSVHGGEVRGGGHGQCGWGGGEGQWQDGQGGVAGEGACYEGWRGTQQRGGRQGGGHWGRPAGRGDHAGEHSRQGGSQRQY